MAYASLFAQIGGITIVFDRDICGNQIIFMLWKAS